MTPAPVPGLGTFSPTTDHDHDVWSRICAFIASEPHAFSRDPDIGGHVTASALVISEDGTSALLSLHRKLGIWIQLGGHCDGIADTRFVALKEAYEESGLARIVLLDDVIFDIDIHQIPETAKERAHLHYDVRFLCQVQAGKIAISDESLDLAWVPLDRFEDYSNEPSLLRMRDKVLARG